MRREYGMRRRAADGERSARAINSFSSVGGGGERETLSVLPLPLPRSSLSGAPLSGECIGNVTRDEGMAGGGREREERALAGPQKATKESESGSKCYRRRRR